MVVLLFALGILMGSFGSILMKFGVAPMGHISISSFPELIGFLFRIFTNITILCGMALYFFSAVIWTYLLTKLPLTYVQPILALTYVTTPILAIFILNERVPLLRWVGILVVIVGVVIVSKTA